MSRLHCPPCFLCNMCGPCNLWWYWGRSGNEANTSLMLPTNTPIVYGTMLLEEHSRGVDRVERQHAN